MVGTTIVVASFRLWSLLDLGIRHPQVLRGRYHQAWLGVVMKRALADLVFAGFLEHDATGLDQPLDGDFIL